MINTLLHPRRLNPRKHLLYALILHRVHPATHRGARRHPGLVLTSIGNYQSAQHISSARPHNQAKPQCVPTLPPRTKALPNTSRQYPCISLRRPDKVWARTTAREERNITISPSTRAIPIPILARVSTSGLLKVCRRVAAPPEPREQGRDISTLLHSIHCMHNPNRRANNYQTNHQYYYNTIPRTQDSLTPRRKV